MVGLDALATFKGVAAWFLSPVEDTEMLLRCLHRLNQGLQTRKWRTYERKEEPHRVRLVLSIDQPSVTALDGMK
jgi:hypothetical protein